jgi:hypothetical protein
MSSAADALISPTVIEKLHDVVNEMESYRWHMMNDVEEVAPYNVAFNVSNYIIAIEVLLAEARFHHERVSG